MKKRRLMALILVTLLSVLAACGNSSSEKSTNSAMSGNTSAGEVSAEQMESDMAVAEDGKDAGGSSSPQMADPDRKLIKRQNYSVETKNFDEFLETLNGIVSSSGGYVEYSEISGNSYDDSGNRYASYTLRVPVENLADFKSGIEKKANIIHSSEQVEDVTLNYVDTESHIAALKAEQESLMSMLEKAEDLESIMAIQTQLTDVRYQLESYQSQIRTYDNAIQYSTISLNVREVEREIKAAESFGGQLKERLSRSLYDIQRGFYSFALWFLGALPYWGILIVLVVAIWLILRKVRKSRRKAHLQRPDVDSAKSSVPDSGKHDRREKQYEEKNQHNKKNQYDERNQHNEKNQYNEMNQHNDEK